MRRKRIVKKIAVFALVLAMQTSLLAYADEPEKQILQEDISTEEEEIESGSPEEGLVKKVPEEPVEEVPTEPEAPAVPGETGAPGWYQQGSDWYYYDASGTKAYGWRFVGGAWYYMDPSDVEKPGVMLASGEYVINGQTYFFGPSGAMRAGWIKEPEGWYYANGSGAMVTGWLQLGYTWYYLNGANAEHPGLMVENGRKVIGNATYFFNNSGAMRTGWIKEEEGWYYSDTVSSVGWKYINGTWYYLDGGDVEYPGRMVADREMNIGGAVYSFSNSGAMRTGWVLKSEGWYYYSGSGAMVTGWLWLGNTWYYLDGADEEHPGLMLDSCKAVIGNATYFFDASGSMRTGWIKEEEGWYYSDNTSSVGWKYVNGAWYYLDSTNPDYPGLMVSDQELNIAGSVYCFNASGAMLTGWRQRPEGWYYYNVSGAKMTGWIWTSAWYYLDGMNTAYPGLMVSDCKMNIGGVNYFFRSSGAMVTGWALRPEGWYYANGSGAMVTGWVNVGGKWYYLDAADPEYPGRMLANCVKQIGNLTYTFNADGSMRVGWVLDENGDWYYYDAYTGQIKYGWQYIGGVWYYLDPNDGGKMLEGGWHEIGGGWYYMYGSGAMVTNWLNLGGKWYYLGSDGAMKTGWQFIGNFWYYMYTQNDPHGGEWGVMASNTSIDGYFLQPNGAMMSAEQYNMYLRAQLYSSSTGYMIMVDRTACRVGIFFGSTGAWNLQYFWACSPGKLSTPTVGGEFTVQGKGYYFDSGTSRCYWYTQFYRDYLFHSVLYNKYTGGLDDGRLGMQLSHGCVRLDINNAKWIYDNVPSGSKVVVY